MLQICENIKTARKASGISQQDMADLLKVKRSTYGRYEQNRVPDIGTLIAIGKALNVDWTSLVQSTVAGEPIKPGERKKSDLERIKEIAQLTKEDTEATRKMVEEILKNVLNK